MLFTSHMTKITLVLQYKRMREKTTFKNRFLCSLSKEEEKGGGEMNPHNISKGNFLCSFLKL